VVAFANCGTDMSNSISEGRKWSKRFFARGSVMPTQTQTGVYSAATHYLNAVDSLGSDEAKAVDMPIRDFFADHDFISSDGRMVHDMYLVEVKKPDARLTSLNMCTFAATGPFIKPNYPHTKRPRRTYAVSWFYISII
jgi:hypothetical protein